MRKIKILTTGINRHYSHSWLLLIILLAAASLSQGQTVRSAAAYYNRGNERYKKGDLDGAIADYDAALIFEPRLARAYNMRGSGSARYNKETSTAASLTIPGPLRSIGPHLALAYYNRGNARRDKGGLAGAYG